MPRLSRLNLGLLCLSIVSMCAALYMSPIATATRADVKRGVTQALGSDSAADLTAQPAASPSASASVPAPAATPSTPSAPPRVATPTPTPATGATAAASAAVSLATPKSAKRTTCASFRWQQDAQVVYLGNLSDPYGLDGKVGPYDGDGLACSALPVDPKRAASTAVGAYVAPTPSAATKARLVNPAQDYFGYSEDGLPGDSSLFTTRARQTGKAPSSVGWFQNFDQPYRGDLVTKSWTAGALPVVTLMPTGKDPSRSYSLTAIANGEWDDYLTRWAGDVVRENLPVAIRFAHEMNNNTYPWSAGMSSYNNSPAKYVAAWQHVWKIFDRVGANDDVIWLWSPSRVDNLTPSATNGISAIADDYPGDAYVDWVGASVYLRRATTGASYAASFAKTVSQLEAVTTKPIFFAETAAIQSDGGVDQTALKAAWIGNVLNAFAADPRVVGFLWFNNVVTSTTSTGDLVNDWRISSSDAALAAFKEVIDTAAFETGVVPDS